MTYAGRSFEADENRERWLEDEIKIEKQIQEDDEELQKVRARLEASAEEGKDFLRKHNLTEEDVINGRRIDLE